MTQLTQLRNKLSSLRNWRSTARLIAAWSAVIVAVLVALMAIFALDFIFTLGIAERVVLFLLGAVAVAWAFNKYAAPTLGISETVEDVALLVETKQSIRSDLIASLQFQGADAADWGSQQLEQAVINDVSNFESKINVFEGFSNETLTKRCSWLLMIGLVVALLCYGFPDYASTFLQRLGLGSNHYPTQTNILLIAVNGATVLDAAKDGTQPNDSICAEGRVLNVLVYTKGVGNEVGRLSLNSKASGSHRDLELEQVPDEKRVESLEQALKLLNDAKANSKLRVQEEWRNALSAAIQYDIPKSLEEFKTSIGDDESLTALRDEVVEVQDVCLDRELFVGKLNRMVDPIQYQCYLGDAWTDTATIDMIPLPVIEPELTAVAPQYARASEDKIRSASSRHLSVLEGSEVKVALRCTNGKSLKEAWITFQKEDKQQRVDLVATDDLNTSWKLDSQDTPLFRVSGETRFELHVLDEHGLQPDAPIRGLVRLRADRLPNGSMTVVHRVVLPAAKPRIDFRMTDDYGISKALLHISARKRQNDRLSVADVNVDGDENTEQPKDDQPPSIPLLANNTIVLAKDLPYTASHEVDLTSFELVKGDQIEITLELIDYRGDDQGESFFSDPLLLEISDESGVLAAISEADERSEQRITDIIKRQLGIGDSP
jgi:hypothetical protein